MLTLTVHVVVKIIMILLAYLLKIKLDSLIDQKQVGSEVLFHC